jgi:anaerobic ribonucleoside-triphosphate reductase activating protein
MNIVVDHIQFKSLVDGPGERTVLFVKGCPIHCAGCQNKALWSPEGGQVADVETVASLLVMTAGEHGQVTITGGEPFAQPQALAALTRKLKDYGIKNIILYTGYTWEQITNPVTPAHLWNMATLQNVDVLVDGPFVASKDDDLVQWRGSRNQRAIHVPYSLEAMAEGRLVVMDWDKPALTVSAEGDLYFAAGYASWFDAPAVKTRRCGETGV